MDGGLTAETIQLALAVIVSGLVSGLLAGLFGIGGGAVLVPVLYQALTFLNVPDNVRMHVSVGTSIAVILPTAIQSFLAHRKRGAVDMDVLRGWIVWVPLGVIIASVVAAMISGAALRAIFAVIALVVAIRMIFDRGWHIGTTLPGNPIRAVVGVGIGFFSTLMGIGGGVLNNTFMTLYSRPIHQAVATSSGVGVLIAIPGVLGYMWAGWGDPGLPPYSLGFVNFVAALLIVPTSVLAAPFGVRLAHRMTRRHLEIAFGLFLLFVAVRFALTLV